MAGQPSKELFGRTDLEANLIECINSHLASWSTPEPLHTSPFSSSPLPPALP